MSHAAEQRRWVDEATFKLLDTEAGLDIEAIGILIQYARGDGRRLNPVVKARPRKAKARERVINASVVSRCREPGDR